MAAVPGVGGDVGEVSLEPRIVDRDAPRTERPRVEALGGGDDAVAHERRGADGSVVCARDRVANPRVDADELDVAGDPSWPTTSAG
jgi:hypothetical protein